MNTIIKRLEQEKSLQLHQFAHEIKNPLVVCCGYLEMIPNSNDKQKEKYFRIIQKEVKRSLSIISSFSERGINSLKIEKFDLRLLLDDIFETFKALFEINNCKMTILGKKEIYINGDYEKLKQVFINLIKNSYESSEKQPLQIIIKVEETKRHHIIHIIDDGCGMTKEEKEKATAKYYTTKKYGNGLGIPYSMEILKQHKGSLLLKSKKGLGTKAIIKIPK